MDQLNQNQDPKFAQLILQEFNQKKGHWTVAVVVIVAVVGLFLVWWYVDRMGFNPLPSVGVGTPSEETKINQINQELERVDVGDLDAEFEAIDSDLNSL